MDSSDNMQKVKDEIDQQVLQKEEDLKNMHQLALKDDQEFED
jgi:hypothetical protein